MADFEIRGAEQLAVVGRQLRGAGKDIKRESMKELRAEGRPAGEAIRGAYGAELPQRGGLAARIRRSTISVSVRLSGDRAGARVNLRNKHDLRAIERGILRHPVFGHRDRWTSQPVPAEIGSRAFQKQSPAVRAAMLRAMERIAKRVTRG